MQRHLQTRNVCSLNEGGGGSGGGGFSVSPLLIALQSSESTIQIKARPGLDTDSWSKIIASIHVVIATGMAAQTPGLSLADAKRQLEEAVRDRLLLA